MERVSLLLTVVLASCAAEPEVKRAPRPSGPSAAEMKLEQHRKLQGELAAAQERHLAAADAFEKSKEEYLRELQEELGQTKAKSRTVQTISTMAAERTRIAEELRASQKMLAETLAARGGASERLLAIEARLWVLEAEVWGGRAQAVAHAEQEVKDFRDVETSLHVAQKGQQQNVAQLAAAEFELNATIGDDIQARDIADRRLNQLRTTLGERMTRLIDGAREYDQSAEKIHNKLLKQMTDQAAASRVKELMLEREKAAAAMASSREALKAAMIKRAEERAREISHDGEIAAVVDTAFKDAKARDALLARVRPKRDAASEARVAMQREEETMGEVRRRLVRLEADIQALGY